MINKNSFIPSKSAGNRVLSDIVAPKRTVAADQMFRPPTPRVRPTEHRRFRKYWKVAFAIFILVGGAIFWSIGTHSMEVKIIPRSERVSVNKILSMTKQPGEADKIFFRTVAVAGTREGVFDGQITVSPVERRAKGTVVVFNKSSLAPQVLIATTRLAAPDGKIYRIPHTITVPGYRTENKEIIPGSKEVEVVADKAGEEYNIGLVDFTVPGFDGSPKFKTIFARSKTPMTGGFAGSEKTILQDDLQKALITLQAQGEGEAYAMVQSKIPPTTLLLKQTVAYAIVDQTIEFLPKGATNKFKLIVKDESRGATVDKEQLTRIVTDTRIPKPFRIINFGDLIFAVSGYQYDGPGGQLKITGGVDAESTVDVDSIKKYIVEERRTKSVEILGHFPVLASVEIRFSPFWFKYPPSDPKRIDIILPVR